MMKGNFEHSLDLTRFILRRERVTSGLWIGLLTVFSMILAPGMSAMFPDAGARMNFAESFNNPMMTAMMGPIYGIDNYTPGAMYGGMMLLWVAIAVAVMNVFLVVRHTRADEERGRSEVVRSLPVGRLAGVNATLLAALAVNGLMGLLIGLGVAATGVETMGFGGSMLYGTVLFAVGVVFAAITALFCQLSSNTGGATGLSMISIGAFYMLRAAGDAQVPPNDFIACLSPLGLVQRSQVYVENHIWPTLILLAIAAAIAAIAYWLNAKRDLGQGFIAAKPGRKEAAPYMLNSFGLAWRLMRGSLIAWVVIMFALGASYGSVVADIGDFIGDSPEYMQIMGISEDQLAQMTEAQQAKFIIDMFGGFVTVMMTLVCFVPIIIAAKKARSEEREGRAEHIVSRSVSRVKYLSGYVALAFAASAVIQFATAAGLFMATESIAEVNPFTFGGLMQSFFAFLPAAWVMIGAAVLTIGFFPKLTGVVWGYFGFVAFTSFIGKMLDLPAWLNSLSPMHHIPQRNPFAELMLGETFTLDLAPLVILTAIALGLTAAGFAGFQKRDTLTGM